MSDTLRTALLFLISTIFNLYLFVLVIRIILVFVHADYFNPFTQFITRLTNFIVKPLRKWLPNIQNIETASIALMFVLEIIKFALIVSIGYGAPNVTGLPILAIADMLSLLLQTFTYAILLQVILSFVQPMSPLTQVLWRFNSPIMHPLQRLIPPVGGFDLTPIPALIILQILNIVLVNPLMAFGQSVTFGY